MKNRLVDDLILAMHKCTAEFSEIQKLMERLKQIKEMQAVFLACLKQLQDDNKDQRRDYLGSVRELRAEATTEREHDRGVRQKTHEAINALTCRLEAVVPNIPAGKE